MGGLHAAMGAGRLDAYRASVVAEELECAPAPVRATVVTLLEGYLEVEDGAHLRRRCRRALARISPDLLRQRALKARAGCGLRRWVEEPGVDRWEGTFPSEDAAQAWAAIDALARRYVADGLCPTIEAARGKALTDLVAGHATIEAVLTLTVPATAASSGRDEPALVHPTIRAGDLVEVTGPTAGDPVLVSRQWLADSVDSASMVQVAPCHPVTGALLDHSTVDEPAHPVAAGGAGLGDDAYRPSTRLAGLVRARDRRCRFPGCSIAAVFCDLDHVRPWPAGPTRDDNLICLCRRHHRIKQRPGWTVTLQPDGVATFTDPTGRARTTQPVDALTSTVLTGPTTPPTSPHSTSRARTVVPDGPHTELEFTLEHLGTPPRGRPRTPSTTWRDRHGTRHRTDLLPPRGTLVLDPTGHWPHRRARRTDRAREADLPPF